MAKTPALAANAPMISVVMPMYNSATYVEKTVRSILAQTYTDFEFIIVDDGSGDGSAAIVERLAAEDARIQLMPMAKNAGCPAATNHGVLAVRGKYIALMDADDIALPERFAKQVEYLESHANTVMLATQYWRMAPDGSLMRKTHNAHGSAVLKFHLMFGVPVCNPTIMFRQSVVAALKPEVFRSRYSVSQDYDFMLRIAEMGEFHILPDYLFYYRIHPKAMGTTNRGKVMSEILGRAIPVILAKVPELARDELAIEAFIRLQRDNSVPLNAARLKAYLKGLSVLRKGYVRHVDGCARAEINAFCFELEAKTLLGRYRIYKKPVLVARWVLNLCRNHLRFMPLWLMCKMAKKVGGRA